MLWHNSTLYVNISIVTLVVSTIVSYVAISIFRYFIDSRNNSDYKFTITITHNGKTLSVSAIADTGNNLADVFTGKPVIVCGKNNLFDLLNQDEIDFILSSNRLNYIDGWRLIPFSTIHSDGTLPIFRPTGTIIKCPEKKILKTADVYIGVVNKEMDAAVFNPKIL